ncbi:hypothetical protein PC121_g17084 [Phytophthora cactorum]|nr:hypothetical protein PC121_g17084 [Phytophthora cactorum]
MTNNQHKQIINIESSARHWTKTIRRGSAHIPQSSTAQPRQAKRMKLRRSPDALAMDNMVCSLTSTTSFDARGLVFTVVLSKKLHKALQEGMLMKQVFQCRTHFLMENL